MEQGGSPSSWPGAKCGGVELKAPTRLNVNKRRESVVSKKHGTMTRRRFLKTAATGVALGLIAKPVFPQPKDDYDLVVTSGDPATATRKALEALGGISRFVKKGQQVVLKPNMSFARPPEAGCNTHPLVVATVAQACMDAGAEQVLVLDHTLQRAELCLRTFGDP